MDMFHCYFPFAKFGEIVFFLRQEVMNGPFQGTRTAFIVFSRDSWGFLGVGKIVTPAKFNSSPLKAMMVGRGSFSIGIR